MAEVNLSLSSFSSSRKRIDLYESALEQMESSLWDLSLAISAATDMEINRPVKNPLRKKFRPIILHNADPDFLKRPQPAYVGEVCDLIRFWEDQTGRKAVSPKGFNPKTQEAHQDSTEFIRLCLKGIDPSIDTKKSITIVRNALSFRTHIQSTLTKILDDAANGK